MDKSLEDISGASGKPIPKKFNLALGGSLPKKGECYNCFTIRSNNNRDLRLCYTSSSPVQSIKKISYDMIFIETVTSYFITMLFNRPDTNYHLALIDSKPVIGKSMMCYLIDKNNSDNIRIRVWHTTSVQEFESSEKVYSVKTSNSIYYCLALF